MANAAAETEDDDGGGGAKHPRPSFGRPDTLYVSNGLPIYASCPDRHGDEADRRRRERRSIRTGHGGLMTLPTYTDDCSRHRRSSAPSSRILSAPPPLITPPTASLRVNRPRRQFVSRTVDSSSRRDVKMSAMTSPDCGVFRGLQKQRDEPGRVSERREGENGCSTRRVFLLVLSLNFTTETYATGLFI